MTQFIGKLNRNFILCQEVRYDEVVRNLSKVFQMISVSMNIECIDRPFV